MPEAGRRSVLLSRSSSVSGRKAEIQTLSARLLPKQGDKVDVELRVWPKQFMN